MPLTGNYTPNTPQGTQQINNTQSPIQTNFATIQELFSVNHESLSESTEPNSLEGQHSLISYYGQSIDPTVAVGEIAMYSKEVANDTNGLELFVRYPNNGSSAGAVNQLTGTSQGGSAVGNSYGLYGYQYIGGGLLMLFGVATVAPLNNSQQTSTFNFSTTQSGLTLPSFNQSPFLFQASPMYSAYGYTFGVLPYTPQYSGSCTFNASAISASQFQITTQTFTMPINAQYAWYSQYSWVAIGI